DALTLASESQPETLIDVATLTGAIKVGLGADIAGLFSNTQNLEKSILKAAHQAGELLWPMPLFQGYRKQLQTPFADLMNAADGYGGAIRAALFLETFIEKKVPWAHLDIYAWKDAPAGPYTEKGGSGQAVQTLIQYLKSL
ncbi:MAG: leucyl aminopeptidase family protein, partial [Bdellovibrio sp.]